TDIFGNAIIQQQKDLTRDVGNVADLGGQIWSIFQRYLALLPEDAVTVGITLESPIFASADHINPLQSFVYSSADDRAERILRELINEDIDSPVPKQLLEAEFTQQLPSAIDVSEMQSNVDLIKVLAMTARIRNSYLPYTNDKIKELPDPQKGFAARLTKFRQCTKLTNPQPPVCAAISDLIATANAGTAGGGKQSRADQDVIDRRDEVLLEFDHEDAPSLIDRYERGEMSVTDLFM